MLISVGTLNCTSVTKLFDQHFGIIKANPCKTEMKSTILYIFNWTSYTVVTSGAALAIKYNLSNCIIKAI